MFGSVPLRAVLPDGDIDISVFTTAAAAAAGPAGGAAGAGPPGELRDTWASQLLRALEREAVRPDAPFKIRDVQIIQAEVRAPGGALPHACLLSTLAGAPCRRTSGSGSEQRSQAPGPLWSTNHAGPSSS